MALFDAAGPVAGPHGPLRLFLKTGRRYLRNVNSEKGQKSPSKLLAENRVKRPGACVFPASIGTYGRKVCLMFA